MHSLCSVQVVVTGLDSLIVMKVCFFKNYIEEERSLLMSRSIHLQMGFSYIFSHLLISLAYSIELGMNAKKACETDHNIS